MSRTGSKRSGRGWPKKPGTLLYFGGAVHEVLSDGRKTREREDLLPDTPQRLWKPKWTKSKAPGHRRTTPSRSSAAKRDWKTRLRRKKNASIKKAFSKHKGALHRMLRVPEGEKIPVQKLRWAVRQGGLLARRAQLVLNMRTARLRREGKKR